MTGRTAIGLTAFYERYTFDNYLPAHEGIDRSSKGLLEWHTNGLYFFIDHDNTDFDLNPSRGYQFKLQYSKDFGWGDSLQSWDFLEFKYNRYLTMPAYSYTRQNILAISFWTGYSFSWDKTTQVRPGIDAHRPVKTLAAMDDAMSDHLGHEWLPVAQQFQQLGKGPAVIRPLPGLLARRHRTAGAAPTMCQAA